MKLKKYQKDSLTTLRKFFEEARITGPKTAYEAMTAEPELAERLKGYAAGYKPIKALPEVPYVCLRLPTGGIPVIYRHLRNQQVALSSSRKQ